eukprot:CAMPEP_0201096530 /NCGR_PEP_ID=MMETSP0812-20130820/5509_1 /ASSEMBLY_ACC=CAM_ASM_000668 /TAXON_ID=98059 /ORGANISM="Dinobryon sp., Strain UTEXLB2267" /LENGTH=256 /DNA_ID=CAMNT_0047350843 /DNA_START=70 /DNA_END=840 /DNA_ORIENTATION=+
MSCCPENSLPYLAPSYTVKGTIQAHSNGHEFYVSGDPTLKKAVLIIPDIYGWNGGRTRNIADYYADNGYYAIVPKILQPAMEGAVDGDGHADVPFNLQYTISITWEGCVQPRVQSMIEHLKSVGIEKAVMIGFCWGGWVLAHTLSDSEMSGLFVCGAVPHPSIQLEQAYGGKPVELLSRVTRPMLLMPAQNDSDSYREGGEWFEALLMNNPSSATIDFPTMTHGWVPRGDVSIPGMEAEVERALSSMLAFFKAHDI